MNYTNTVLNNLNDFIILIKNNKIKIKEEKLPVWFDFQNLDFKEHKINSII